MSRIKSIPFAIGAVILSAGSVFAFTAMPLASGPGLTKATAASGHTVPVRDATDGNDQGEDIDVDAPETETPDTDAPDGDSETGDGPEAGSHGALVSAVAQAPDTTPDTNHGADVSLVARDNHGQATAATKKAAHAAAHTNTKKPAHAGKPG